MTPSWWDEGAPVSDESGRVGILARTTRGLAVRLQADGPDAVYVVDPSPDDWRLDVHQGLTTPQLRRVIYDCDRALAHAFGCSYVADFNHLGDSLRSAGGKLTAAVVGRPELDGIRALLRGLLREGLTPYVKD